MAQTALPMGSHAAPLDSTRLTIQRSTELQPVSWLENPDSAARTGTDHMLTVRWTSQHGWADPAIVPYGNLTFAPTASCLHYATQCYEGLKAYRGHDGVLRLFRPDRNCERLKASALRVSLPSFDTRELQRLIIALLAIDAPRWLPADTCRGRSLYVRPAMVADAAQIGVRLPEQALLFVIVVPWPELPASTLSKGLDLVTSSPSTIRAWPGGFGYAKLGANYGPNFLALGEAQARGFDQVLWLFGEEGLVTEAGSSNFFVVWKNEAGVRQLVTAPLDDGLILPGVTRDSVLALARTRLVDSAMTGRGLEVVERAFEMRELSKAADEGRLIEAFVSGTAYFITPVARINWSGRDVLLPAATSSETPYSLQFRSWLKDIMYGIAKDPWAVEIQEV